MGISRTDEVAEALWYCGPGQAEIRQETLPPAQPGELRVRALYGAISRGTEGLVLSGRVPESEYERMRAPFMAGNFPFPVKYGYATVGRVEQGADALVGRAVWGTGNEIGFTRDGSHAEYLVLPADAVALKPERLSFEEASSCGVPYITAWHALEAIVPPSRLLVIGGAGAVAFAAMQLARRKGLQPVAAVRSGEQARRLKAREFDAVVVEQTVSGEWDAIFDTTGHWLAPAIGALAPFGRVVVIFAPGDGRPQVPVRDLYRRGASIVGINSLAYSPADCARLLSELAPAFESGELRPPERIVARPLSEATEAYAALQRGQKGKVVLVP